MIGCNLSLALPLIKVDAPYHTLSSASHYIKYPATAPLGAKVRAGIVPWNVRGMFRQ